MDFFLRDPVLLPFLAFLAEVSVDVVAAALRFFCVVGLALALRVVPDLALAVSAVDATAANSGAAVALAGC